LVNVDGNKSQHYTFQLRQYKCLLACHQDVNINNEDTSCAKGMKRSEYLITFI
jgi:hypothetical protein